MTDLDPTDADRLDLLDRIEKRLPELHLYQREVEWTELPDGAQALLVDGGGFDGGDGFTFANAGEDVHALGSTSLLIPGTVGCVVIAPDGSRRLARVMPDPLAQQR